MSLFSRASILAALHVVSAAPVRKEDIGPPLEYQGREQLNKYGAWCYQLDSSHPDISDAVTAATGGKTCADFFVTAEPYDGRLGLCTWDQTRSKCKNGEKVNYGAIANSEQCEDDPTFVDAYNYNCHSWYGYPCTPDECAYWSYTPAECAAVVAGCPLTCDACPPPILGGEPAPSPEPSSGEPSPDPSSGDTPCVDDDTFKDMFGYDCLAWETDPYGCDYWAVHYGSGTSLDYFAPVVAACPAACGLCPTTKHNKKVLSAEHARATHDKHHAKGGLAQKATKLHEKKAVRADHVKQQDENPDDPNQPPDFGNECPEGATDCVHPDAKNALQPLRTI
jgi:hypothetical protein